MARLAVLGCGVMGSAILSALLEAGDFTPGQVRVSVATRRSQERLQSWGVEVTSNARAVKNADVVIVALKPVLVPRILEEVRDNIPDDALLISVAAGVRVETLEAGVPEGVAVVRVMPNTPVVVRQGMLVMSAGKEVDERLLARATALLSHCGRVLTVPEKQLDAVTGLSGSGAAYIFSFVDALIEGGVVQGLSRPVATELTLQTVLGAAALLQGGEHPAILREQVTSPAGTTAAGLRVLDSRAVRSAVVDAVEAATLRSREMGSQPQ